MAEERPPLPLIDLVSIIVSPVLVMLMVGSLAFFLIEVLYAGRYEGRLLYTYFFFVIGSVLIARISIQEGYRRASIFGLGLGLACFLAMLKFVDYPTSTLSLFAPILNLLIMGIVWWSANKLTWDCTHLDESRKTSGRGVLAAAGLDDARATTAADDEEVFDPNRSETVPGTRSGKKPKKSTEPTEGLLGWWTRFQKYREFRKKRPHTPGVWVLYFALAAIPIFGLGQSLIPANDEDRRQDTFLQMAVYVGSALALLMTTTLMGLKRYLETRNARLSSRLTLVWLSLGGVLIAMFLGIAALLPRPHSETPLFTWKKSKSDGERGASRNAAVRDRSTGEGEGTKGAKGEIDKDKNGQGSGNTKGQGNDQSSGGKDKSGSPNGGNKTDAGKDKGSGSSQTKGERGADAKGDQSGMGETNSPEDEVRSTQAAQMSAIGERFEILAKFFKWLIWSAIAILVLFGFLLFGLKWLAPFTAWAQGLLDWLNALLKKKPKAKRQQVVDAQAEVSADRLRPFSEFSNPFSSGSAEDRDLAELVVYTFTAWESWASEQDLARTPDETPAEFARKVAEEFPDLEGPGRALAALLVRLLYSQTPLPEQARKTLERFWDELATAERIIAT